ncbi:Digalactosyldiacylglycerol synthase 2, chloroplastic [Gracilariopsis chorda]|uniref:Digalactosyldiacylglycerol synthase 2, chloroplastic n=1 Tax=Gracilariopsis chorda TaxID=448386 RepID=A0A2V3J2B9_9FLOR|nr:Digalactosyldiacylglycerol synthase 2, chloroplastic [Gracilariopsis chorda]|eukprot:PXF48242.1 Digalactosyldiacylglycerol synthase 2, chloroplastic [Gracilariopsis chorda]
MPPLLASLATALLTSSRRVAHSSAPSSDIVEHAHYSVSDKHTQHQHPTVALAAAYALFLVGRQNAVASHSRSGRVPTRLAVSLDLHCPSHVDARHIDGPPTVPCQPRHSSQAALPPQEHLTAASDMRASKRDVAIVTTAAIPWMTGTSVNPALRALYLAHDGHRVTLIVPWIPPEQQGDIFASGSPVFTTRQQQRDYIQNWGYNQLPATFDVLFYEGVYAPQFGSILPVGAMTDVIVSNLPTKDVCILEEPEHLTWHHSGKIWTELFNYVVGIIHTNYIEYAKKVDFFGPQKAVALLLLNMWVCRGYCHRIIKLSDAVQHFPNSVTSNVHGVRDKFMDIGIRRSGPFPRGAYFMGKVLWAKGYRDLINCMIEHYNLTKEPLAIDFYGAGPDVPEVREQVDTHPALSAVAFDARVADPTSKRLQGYKVFVNASKSDVVCTATAEALAMGKLVVCLDHPSNEFFATFPNCTTYRTPDEFSKAVLEALEREPQPLSDQDAYRLTWEAATERLYDAMRVPLSKSKPSKVGAALANAHLTLSKIYPQPGKGIQKAMSRESLNTAGSVESL